MQATEELVAQADPSLALGRYRLGPRIGAGGFGTVYEARDERLGRSVAVKAIPADGRADERARREAHAVARLDHPGIVSVFDAGEEDGTRFLVSELVRGSTLAQLETAGEVSDRDVLRIGLALADALAHAHERGVIHRDVKPQNVMVPDRPRSPYGAAKLTDFGVAHLAGDEPLTRTGDVVGTLAYMAPEQAAGERVDERCDLYALGLVLYEGLAGVNPVRAGSPAATLRRVGLRPAAARQGARRPARRAVRRASTARCARSPTSAATSPTSPTRWPRRCRPSPTRAAPSRRTRSRTPTRCRPGAPAPPPRPRRARSSCARSRACSRTPRCPPSPPPPRPRCSSALLPGAGWIVAAAATLAAMTFGTEPRVGAALLVFLAVALPPLALRTRAARVVRARRGARARAARARRRLPGARRHRAQRLDARGARRDRAVVAAAGRAAARRARCCSGSAPTCRRGRAGTAPRASPRARSCNRSSPPARCCRPCSGASAALVMPWLVRGRSLSADVVAATVWAAGLAGATASLGGGRRRLGAEGTGCGSARCGHPRRGMAMGRTARPRNLTSHTPRHA